MSQQAAAATPAADVAALMQQVADEHGLELAVGLPGAAVGAGAAAVGTGAPSVSARISGLGGGGGAP